MPTLVLVRHASAEPAHRDDHARRLTSHGRAEAVELRAWLADVQPDRVLVSSAARARETWELAGAVPADVSDDLYAAGTTELRELVGLTPPEVTTLVVVGHNPTLERLAWELDDAPAARELTNRGMRPSGAAVFALASWDADRGELLRWR